MKLAAPVLAGLCSLSLGVSAHAQLSQGADILYSNINDVATYGPVSGRLAYALGSNTCNIGNQNNEWNFNGAPGLAMNIYRVHNGRLMQLGASFVKHACCAAAGNGCTNVAGQALSCNGQGGNVLGAGCLDVYSAGYNGGHDRLGPRSNINPWTGSFGSYSSGSGDAIFKRAQVQQSDMNTTVNFPGAVYFAEGVYVATADAIAGNRNNNASYKRVVNTGNGVTLTPTGSMYLGFPAIQAWRDHGLGANTPDPSVRVASIDIPSEGRFWYAYKSRDLGGGQWRYEYAVFNLSSHLSGGSLTIPVPADVTVTNLGFYAPPNHSGEIYNNDAWTMTRNPTNVTFATAQTFAVNANANAIRWGTMYNFWFDANTPPSGSTVNGTLGLFRPSATPSVTIGLGGPTAMCDSIDVDGNGIFPDTGDIDYFLAIFAGAPCAPAPARCDIDFNNDGLIPDTLDISALVSVFSGGQCLR